VVKSRTRGTNNPGYGGYIVADDRDNSVLGTNDYAFSAALEDVETLLGDWEARRTDSNVNAGVASWAR
jgi:hypothetical protein